MKCERFLNKLQIEETNEDLESNEDIDNINGKEEEEDFSLISG